MRTVRCYLYTFGRHQGGVWTDVTAVHLPYHAGLCCQRSLGLTRSRCHGNQERVPKVPASWEDNGGVYFPLPSCPLAVHSNPTTASTTVESMVYGYVQYIVARQKVCMVEELSESIVWQEAIGLGSIKTYLEAHRDVFDLEEKGESVVVRFMSATHILWVSPAELCWTHSIIQRLFPCGRCCRVTLPVPSRMLSNHLNCP